MPVRSVAVASPAGLHARPAAQFVKAAAACGVPVTVRKAGSDAAPVSAASMLEVLTLGAAQGDVVELSAEGEGAEEALDGLVALLERPEA